MNDKEIWVRFVEPQWDEHLKHSPEDREPGYRACPKCFIEVFKKGYIQGRQDERERIVRNLFFAKKQVDVFEVAKLVKFEDDPVGLVEAGRIMEKLKKEGLIEIAGGEEVNEK